MNIQYRGNEYVRKIPRLFNECPKTVLAAIAVSYASSGGDHLEIAERNLCYEWVTLFENGIVPQRPPQWAFNLHKVYQKADEEACQ